MSSLFELDPLRVAGSGTTTIGIAGEALGNRNLVYLAADGTWQLADADLAATMFVVGLTMSAATTGQRVQILLMGYIGLSTWTWTVGGESGSIYASATPGELTQTIPTPPDKIQVVGIATSATQILFDPSGGGRGLGEVVEGFSYIVDTDGTYIWTKSGSTGEVVFGGPDNAGAITGTDAEAVIQACIDAGGATKVRDGTYYDMNLTITGDNIIIVGESMLGTIFNNRLTDGSHVISITGANFVTLRNFRLVGNASSGRGVTASNANYLLLERLRVEDHGGRGVHLDNSGGSLIEPVIRGLNVANCGDHGIYIDGGNSGAIISTRSGGNTLDGLFADSMQNLFVGIACVFDSNTRYGVTTSACSPARLTGIQCEDNAGGIGVNIAGGTNVSLESIYCLNNGATGIQISGDRATVKSCWTVGHTQGLWISVTADGTEVSGSNIFTTGISDNSVSTLYVGYLYENNVLSPQFAIDAIAVVAVTIAHGLGVTPAVEDCQLTLVEDTDVDDFALGWIKVDSSNAPDATNVYVKINVTTASVTVGAKARLALHVTSV